MLFCTYTIESNSNSIGRSLLKNINIFLKEKKENTSNISLITVNKNVLNLKIWSPFQRTLQKVILYPEKS